MTKEEYDERKAEYIRASRVAIAKLDREFAFANNIVHLNDIITDHRCTIKVCSFKIYHRSEGYPGCRYDGIALTKKREPFKAGKLDSVLQGNLKTINGYPYGQS